MRARQIAWAIAIVVAGHVALHAGPSPGRAPAAARQSPIPASSLASFAQDPQGLPRRTPDVIYVPTSQTVVETMLKMAHVTSDDVVYDLGCGDGRIVVTAARLYGARGVGIDIDPQRVREAHANVEKEGVGNLVKIIEGDLFETPIGEASVVTLYLLPTLNVKLIPKLNTELKPGTRIVSHAFDMGEGWPPEQQMDVDGTKVFFWTMVKRH